MIKHAIEQVIHIENYGIASLVIFFLFFSGTLFWAFRLNRSYLTQMGSLPLDSDSNANPSTLSDHD